MKKLLISMTLVAVVSDYLLHPFYPQFFELRFGVKDPASVGYYFAAICGIVMLAFPFWAYVSKKIAELHILVFTQCIAGILALYCYWTTSYINFWMLSLFMVVFKASYLLVYPYILKICAKEEHPTIIGTLSVIVHLGGILGAVIGGLTVDFIDPSTIFLIMAAGDFIQMGMSWYLVRSPKYSTVPIVPAIANVGRTGLIPKGRILKIGLITFVLYGSDFLIRPFFASYWESISIYDAKLIAGTIYAIPGFVALLALWYNTKWAKTDRTPSSVGMILLLTIIGIALQGIPEAIIIIIGRVLYGWAVFQAVVKFDVFLFEESTPASYSLDYSKVHFFQNLGVLLASFSVGMLVEYGGFQIPFVVSFIGVLITLAMYYWLYRVAEKNTTKKLVNT